MGNFLKSLLILVIGVGLIVWTAHIVRATFPGLHFASLFSVPAVPPIQPVQVATNPNGSSLVANAISSQLPETTLTGTTLLDASSGYAKIPYIVYLDERGHTATKQLIFDDTRGCSSYAGDFPCVNRSETGAYPKLVNGAPITVTGELYEDRFIVDNIQYQ